MDAEEDARRIVGRAVVLPSARIGRCAAGREESAGRTGTGPYVRAGDEAGADDDEDDDAGGAAVRCRKPGRRPAIG